MQCSLSAGSDAAGLCIFDPLALPGDFDGRLRDEPTEALEELAAAGRLCRWDTGADGAYRLALWVDEELPPDLGQYAQPLTQLPTFQVPGGRLYFTGVEYVFREDDSFLKKHPHMGQSADVSPGVYGFELYSLVYPEGHYEETLNRRLSPDERRFHSAMEVIFSIGVVLLFVALVSLFILGLRPWVTMVLPVATIVALGLWGSTRLPVYGRVDQVRRSLELEQPDYALVLRRRIP